ncbi:DUF6438 domain-containing protein [Zhouia sp. PK063]|uniref:DUF6438 domain-containing protein n=1 Tax=Zhouia sp. PK063 TaxID=3373602 RepID=UPI0037B6442E
MWYRFLCTLLSFGMLACHSINNQNESVDFEISTSPCFGECPILDAKLHDNSIYFNLIKYNNVKGLYIYKLKKNEREAIKNLITQIAIDSLKDRSTTFIPDVQYMNSILSYKKKKKEILFIKSQAPISYQKFVNYILKFKDSSLVKIDTTINFMTRKKVPILEMGIPPMPNN